MTTAMQKTNTSYVAGQGLSYQRVRKPSKPPPPPLSSVNTNNDLQMPTVSEELQVAFQKEVEAKESVRNALNCS
jgi:hypothetical protein